MKRAGQTSGSLASTGRWRSQVAARKVAHAQDRRSSQTSFPGAVTAPDSRQLCRRSGDGFRVPDRKSTRLNSSHLVISYAVFCLKKKTDIYEAILSRHFDDTQHMADKVVECD